MQMEEGGIQVDTSGLGQAEALRGLARHPHEKIGESGLEELVQNTSEPVVIEMFGSYPRPDEMLGGLAREELLKQVKGSAQEPQAV